MIPQTTIMAWTKYTTVPRCEYPFQNCDALTRYAFGLIFDRWKLSAKEENWVKFTDCLGTYCVYDRKELAAELGITQPTLRRCLDKLVDEGLIHVDRAERFGAYRYYLTTIARVWLGEAEPKAKYAPD